MRVDLALACFVIDTALGAWKPSQLRHQRDRTCPPPE